MIIYTSGTLPSKEKSEKILGIYFMIYGKEKLPKADKFYLCNLGYIN